MFCPKTGPSLQAEKPRLKICRRQAFHNKLRNQGCSFTRDLIGSVASRCFPHPTLSFPSEQTLKDLESPRGTHEEARRMDLANWALRTSPKFATGVKHQFHQGFFTRSEKPRLKICRRQVFHSKLRNQGCSFTRDLICSVGSRCFPQPTLSLASEQTLKYLKSSQRHQRRGEENGFS